jgi:hypothetical protein
MSIIEFCEIHHPKREVQVSKGHLRFSIPNMPKLTLRPQEQIHSGQQAGTQQQQHTPPFPL